MIKKTRIRGSYCHGNAMSGGFRGYWQKLTAERLWRAMKAVDEFLKETQSFRSEQQFSSALGSSLSNLGFDLFCYFAPSIFGQTLFVSFPSMVTNYPRQWTNLYVRKNYHLRDPTVAFSRSRLWPLHWDILDWSSRLHSRYRDFLDDCNRFGIIRGVTFPIHDFGDAPGIFTVASSRSAREFRRVVDENSHQAHIIAYYTHAIVLELLPNTLPENRPKLSDNEKEVLYLAALGKTSWESAKIINKAESTVNFHLKQAMNKLQAVNKCHAVAKATAHKLLEL